MILNKISSIINEKYIYLDDENLENIKNQLLEYSESISMDYEREKDILALSLLLILLKDNDGLIDLRQIFEEIYKKLDKIAIFLK